MLHYVTTTTKYCVHLMQNTKMTVTAAREIPSDILQNKRVSRV